MRRGHLITLVVAAALAATAVRVAVVSPLYSGGHLIAAPLIATAAGALLIRLAFVTGRTRA